MNVIGEYNIRMPSSFDVESLICAERRNPVAEIKIRQTTLQQTTRQDFMSCLHDQHCLAADSSSSQLITQVCASITNATHARHAADATDLTQLSLLAYSQNVKLTVN